MLPVLLLIVLIAFAFVKKPHTNPAGNTSAARTPAGSLSLITEPTAGVAPVLSSINSAKSSVDLVMYELEDAQVEQALGQAEQRGVHVRVLLNGGYYGRPDKTNPNQTAYDYLQSQQVPVRWTPSYFALTHQKTLIIDGKTSLIMTFNLTPQYYSSSRDFGIIDKDAPDVSAIESTFNGDWQDKKMTAPKGDELVWSPGSETTTIGLINQAKTSLKIYNEEMADTKVVSALGAAALRGVNEKIVMTDSSEWHANFAKLKNDGAVIKIFASKAPLYIHAKMIVVDNTSVFVGSENFSTTSLTRNRELGIVTPDKTIISSLDTTFSSDFQNATPY
jgi:phosphatidylserine/phosphatidylglycerophosphate/cardiolipin synthase-like enzyme